MEKTQETYASKQGFCECLNGLCVTQRGKETRCQMPTHMKQLKSRHKDLRDLFAQNITVRHVLEKLQSCRADDDATIVRKRMKEKLDFDVMGVEEDGEVYGYVEQSTLRTGPCRRYRNLFLPSELIAESTPLIDLLLVLHGTPRIFVLDRNKVTGIVTRGDLQKAPVRMLLFGLVTLLEMHLLRLVRIHYPKDSWQSLLSSARLNKAKNLFAERKARNETVDLADCLQFCDKRELVLKTPEIEDRIRRKCGKSGKLILESTEKLRDKLAHAQDLVTGSMWPELIDLVKDIEQLLELFECIE